MRFEFRSVWTMAAMIYAFPVLLAGQAVIPASVKPAMMQSAPATAGGATVAWASDAILLPRSASAVMPDMFLCNQLLAANTNESSLAAQCGGQSNNWAYGISRALARPSRPGPNRGLAVPALASLAFTDRNTKIPGTVVEFAPMPLPVWTESPGGFPHYELFIGYSNFMSFPGLRSDNRIVWASGFSTSFAINLSRMFGIVFDFANYHVNRFGPGAPPIGGTVNARGNVFSYMTGPRLSWRNGRFTPFIQVLFGEMDATRVTLNGCGGAGCTPLPFQSSYAANAGGGLDLTLTHNLALRLFQAEYAWTHFPDPTSATGRLTSQNNVRLSTGIVFRFGGDKLTRSAYLSPANSCTAHPLSVLAQSGDTVAVRSDATDPYGLPISYGWTTTGGAIEGSGSHVRWHSSGLTTGTYTIISRVRDSNRQTAECSVKIHVLPSPRPSVRCSADHNNLTAGESTLITAAGHSPEQYPLVYSWTMDGNPMAGNSPTTKFNSTHLVPGTYIVTGHVDDGHGGSADCNVRMEVSAQPVSLPALVKRLTLHSIYFPTNQPGLDNDSGNRYSGLLSSQQTILKALAVNFLEYLKLQPDAKLTLEGHADARGSAAYNEILARHRAVLCKQFLIDQGVPAGSLLTRSFGKQQQLDANQVRAQMNADPNLSGPQRQALFAHLHSIILAQNRRVDIVLDQTGQKSTRRYPFNAHDALTLLNDKDLNH